MKLENNYRSTAHILGAASGLIARNEDRLGKTLYTEGEAGERPRVSGVWDSEEEARQVGEEIEQLHRQKHSLDQIAILVRASFQMREFEERFITLGVPYRVIGGPRFYERPGDPRRAGLPARGGEPRRRPRLRAHRQHAEARPGRLHDRHPAGLRPRPRPAADRLRGHDGRDRRAEAEAAADPAGPGGRFRAAGGGSSARVPHSELAERILEESGYTDFWQKDRSAEAAGRLENLKELVRSMEEFPDLVSFLEHISLVMDTEGANTGERRVHHDAARRQGAGVRHRVPAGLGGGAVPPPALARRQRQGGAGGGAAARLCGDHAGEAPRLHLFRHQPTHPRDVADHHPVALPRRAARGPRRGGRERAREAGRLRPVALRHRAGLRRLVLRHAGLAAGAAPGRGGDERRGAPAGGDRGRG